MSESHCVGRYYIALHYMTLHYVTLHYVIRVSSLVKKITKIRRILARNEFNGRYLVVKSQIKLISVLLKHYQ